VPIVSLKNTTVLYQLFTLTLHKFTLSSYAQYSRDVSGIFSSLCQKENTAMIIEQNIGNLPNSDNTAMFVLCIPPATKL
jgi:hypothetical protein